MDDICFRVHVRGVRGVVSITKQNASFYQSYMKFYLYMPDFVVIFHHKHGDNNTLKIKSASYFLN